VLLHICCGVCATAVVERLLRDGHRVTGYFYNPNIHPVDEYRKRLEEAGKVARRYGFDLVEAPYDRENWFETVKGKEYEPEGGARCLECFRMRLERAYQYMEKHMFDAFTTTLSVSPHKDAAAINDLGMRIGGEKFITADFKKKGGFARAGEIAAELSLYRQDYCGSIYSLEEKLKKEKG